MTPTRRDEAEQAPVAGDAVEAEGVEDAADLLAATVRQGTLSIQRCRVAAQGSMAALTRQPMLMSSSRPVRVTVRPASIRNWMC